jgi:hypothetical protein
MVCSGILRRRGCKRMQKNAKVLSDVQIARLITFEVNDKMRCAPLVRTQRAPRAAQRLGVVPATV